MYLENLVKKHATGEVSIPTELEQIMLDEAEELIKRRFDNKEGSSEMSTLIARAKAGKNLLMLTDLDRQIKLKTMPRTWEFTRPTSMLFKLVETWFKIIISNTQSLIYICMIYSMYVNAGIISLLYPLMVFGYALLEETRPNR